MRLRNWALAAAAVLLLAAAMIPAQRHFASGSKAAQKRDPDRSKSGSRARPVARASDSAHVDVDAAAPPKVSIPDISTSLGSCIQDDGKGGQVCTDYFGAQADIEANKLVCRKLRKFVSAAWVDAPCDHASSHGGCWTSTDSPARIRWFYGESHKDFQPGRDTRRVCGGRSLAFKPDGTPVNVSGTSEVPGDPPGSSAEPPAEER